MSAPELRRTLRFKPKEGKVRILSSPDGTKPAKEATNGEYSVSNVSIDGLCFKTPFKTAPGEDLTISFKTPHLLAPMNLACKVVWCTQDEDTGYDVGVSFLDLKDLEKVRIDTLPGCVDLKQVHLNPELCRHVPAALALRRNMVPFSYHNGTLHVALTDPNDSTALDALRRVARCNVKVYQAEEEAVKVAARMLYAGERRTTLGGEEDSQAVAFLNDLVRTAMIRRASDIHLEPQSPARARLRVDGKLVHGPEIGDSLYPAVISRMKVLSGLDIAERRESQDGRTTWRLEGSQPVDMRVATIPTTDGEHMTIRLLGGHHGPQSLQDLGMLPRELSIFSEAIAFPYGLILLTGPTGCGKSTTLYAALEEINNPDLHILSVEDPVERRIQGISQVQVDQADKVGFDSALRSLLRHDPDVIMIGEIRDELSLDVALKSALTGHLVFSSLHTNDSTSATARLVHIGAPPYLVAATLSLVVAQRLVRKLCPECKRPGALDPRAARVLNLEPGLPIKMPGGCLACGGTGYTGRLGLFEFFVATDQTREMIVRDASAGQIRAAAMEEGMQTLNRDGAEKVRLGLTDPGEVLRAVAGTIELQDGS